ncbi:MAG: hypothetical protein HYU36_00120 [Planctomycetes bacterium]|nr:hypothetical protein [Planctomycetota bacterium]
MRHPLRFNLLLSAGAGVALAGLIVCTVFTSGARAEDRPKFKFTGAGNCSAAKCHGGAEAVKTGNTQTNEFTIWSSKDKHAKAFETLSKDESAEIAKKMELGDATKADKCLSCHSTGDGDRQGLAGKAFKDKDLQGVKYDAESGVSCDACHGPSEKWLEPHSKPGWTNEQRAKTPDRKQLFMSMGLYDTKQIMLRANNCVSCHLRIDTRMIEAGHPELTFELASFSRDMPPHWKESGPMAGPRTWAAGQTAALREALLQVAERSAGENDVDEIKMSWKQARGHAMLLRHALPADAAQALNDSVKTIEADAGEPKKLGPAAKDLAGKVDSWGAVIEKMEFDQAKTLALLGKIVNESEGIACGLAGTEQTAMAVDALFGAYKDGAGQGLDGSAADNFSKGLDDLFAALDEEKPEGCAQKATEGLKACAEACKAFK